MLRQTKLPLLIVEDDAHLRYLMQAAAERTGLFGPIHTCEDGLAALDYLQTRPEEERPGLIASDLSMPRMTGLELLRAVKADPVLRSIPVGIVTSSDLPNDREEALTAGACAFIAKPFGLEALARVYAQLHESATTPAAAGA